MQLLELGHLPSCMPKYGNFENQPLSRKPLPIEQKYAKFRHPGIERECMSLLLELWPMGKLVVKQSPKAHGPFFWGGGAAAWSSCWETCTRILSLNLPFGVRQVLGILKNRLAVFSFTQSFSSILNTMCVILHRVIITI